MTEYFTMLWTLLQGGLIALTALTVIDVIFGILVALFIKKDFKWVYLNHFMTSDVMPILGWVAVVIITTIPAVPTEIMPVVSGTVYTFVLLSIVASVLESFSAIGILTNTLGKIGIGNKE
jgi:hypothetical protein